MVDVRSFCYQLFLNISIKMVFYRRTEYNNNIETFFIYKRCQKSMYTRCVPIKMLTATKSLFSDIGGF